MPTVHDNNHVHNTTSWASYTIANTLPHPIFHHPFHYTSLRATSDYIFLYALQTKRQAFSALCKVFKDCSSTLSPLPQT
jgi:hypothetical protein